MLKDCKSARQGRAAGLYLLLDFEQPGLRAKACFCTGLRLQK